MAQKNQGVRFVRIRGKIVPIKSKQPPKTKKKKTISSVAIGAGIGIALAAPKRFKPKKDVLRELVNFRKNTATAISFQHRMKVSDVLANASFKKQFKAGLMKRIFRDSIKAAAINVAVLGSAGYLLDKFKGK